MFCLIKKQMTVETWITLKKVLNILRDDRKLSAMLGGITLGGIILTGLIITMCIRYLS